jgi:sialate O-acetylesterase
MNLKLSSSFTIFLALAFFSSCLNAAITVDRMFSDGMVLQREQSVPVWGTAEVGELVTVTFREQSKQATSGKDGKWMVKLDAMKLGPAGKLTVSCKANKVDYKDVLVGEVWVGSGQSNMAGGAGGYAKRDADLAKIIAGGPYQQIRLHAGSAWKVADEASMPRFSAIHLSFGYALQQELKVPVGLMVGAVGGTPSGRWLSEEMAAADTELAKQFKAANSYSLSDFVNDREAFMKEWQAKVAKAKAEGKRAPRGPARIGDLYARHIQYMVPYGMRGVLWDQGESKTQIPGVADQYVVMNALITGWRKVWGQGDFHFLHVQKPSGGVCPWDPDNPVNRGAKAFSPNLPGNHFDRPNALAYHLDHVRMGTLKNAPLVTALDLGTGVHPSNKSGYGKRACRVALGSVYGRKVAISGPVYKSHKVEGNKVRVSFDHVGKGLAFRHAKALQGFGIAGANGKWVWAEATIDGESVVLSHSGVTNPVNVQYAFSNNPSYANFFNKDGLPGLTFTTVKWER